ncbi:MAG: hypothetical protein IJB10_00645 [Clostridia bacterium]|nr:hypothetical protein [Clostridia bacterium]
MSFCNITNNIFLVLFALVNIIREVIKPTTKVNKAYGSKNIDPKTSPVLNGKILVIGKIILTENAKQTTSIKKPIKDNIFLINSP